MLTATRRQDYKPFARRLDYQLDAGDRPIGTVAYSRFAGAVRIGAEVYEIVSRTERTPWQSFWKRTLNVGADNFALEDRSGAAAAWIDMSANDVQALRYGDRVYDLRRGGKWESFVPKRALKLRATRRAPVLGEVDYGFAGSKTIVADLPADFPLAVQALVIWAAIYCIQNPGAD